MEYCYVVSNFNCFTGSIASSEAEADQHEQPTRDRIFTYQASSPDEVALVQWTQEVGLALNRRGLTSMQLHSPDGHFLNYSILMVFPFTSETKRMGVIVKVNMNWMLWLYLKNEMHGIELDIPRRFFICFDIGPLALSVFWKLDYIEFYVLDISKII